MFTSSSGTFGDLPSGVGRFDCLDEKPDAGAEFGGGALERGQGFLVASWLACGVGDAPMDQLGAAGELGADLAHAIAEADHVVEALPGEFAQVFGTTAGEVDAALAHHPYTAFGCRGFGWLPALAALTAPPDSGSQSASAICERALLPVQRNRTRASAERRRSRRAR